MKCNDVKIAKNAGGSERIMKNGQKGGGRGRMDMEDNNWMNWEENSRSREDWRIIYRKAKG